MLSKLALLSAAALVTGVALALVVGPSRPALATPPEQPRSTSTLEPPIALSGTAPGGKVRLTLLRPGIAVANVASPFHDGAWTTSKHVRHLNIAAQKSFTGWLEAIFDRIEKTPVGRSLIAALAPAPIPGREPQSWSTEEKVTVVIFRGDPNHTRSKAVDREPWSHEPIDLTAATSGAGCVSSLTVPDGTIRGYRGLDGRQRLEAPELSVANLLIRSWHASFGALAGPDAHTALEVTLGPDASARQVDRNRPWGIRTVPNEDIFVHGEPHALRSALSEIRGDPFNPSAYVGFAANPYVVNALSRNGLPSQQATAHLRALAEPPTLWKLAHQLGVLIPPLVAAPSSSTRGQAALRPSPPGSWPLTATWRGRKNNRLLRSQLSDWDLTAPVSSIHFLGEQISGDATPVRVARFAEVETLRRNRERATTFGSALNDLTSSLPPGMRADFIQLFLNAKIPIQGQSTSTGGC